MHVVLTCHSHVLFSQLGIDVEQWCCHKKKALSQTAKGVLECQVVAKGQRRLLLVSSGMDDANIGLAVVNEQ